MGSVDRAILQVVVVTVGIFIYMPFVRLYDKETEQAAMQNISTLAAHMKQCEESNCEVIFTKEDGTNSDISKLLVNNLKTAIDEGISGRKRRESACVY